MTIFPFKNNGSNYGTQNLVFYVKHLPCMQSLWYFTDISKELIDFLLSSELVWLFACTCQVARRFAHAYRLVVKMLRPTIQFQYEAKTKRFWFLCTCHITKYKGKKGLTELSIFYILFCCHLKCFSFLVLQACVNIMIWVKMGWKTKHAKIMLFTKTQE